MRLTITVEDAGPAPVSLEAGSTTSEQQGPMPDVGGTSDGGPSPQAAATSGGGVSSTSGQSDGGPAPTWLVERLERSRPDTATSSASDGGPAPAG
jgi:hypothetical protein